MAKLRPFTYYGKTEIIGYHFYCPGCRTPHSVYTAEHGGGPVWGFNGNLDKATFTPSLLCYAVAPHDDWPGIPRCHSFIRSGQIQFLADSEHAMKDQTVDIPDWNEAMWES